MFSSFRAFLFRENKFFHPIRSTGSVRFFRRVGQVVGQHSIRYMAYWVDTLEFHGSFRSSFRAVFIKGDGHGSGPLQFL